MIHQHLQLVEIDLDHDHHLLVQGMTNFFCPILVKINMLFRILEGEETKLSFGFGNDERKLLVLTFGMLLVTQADIFL